MDTAIRKRIERYIQRTKFKGNAENYDLRMSEWRAIAEGESRLTAVAIAFSYGRAKGYRAAKAEK